MICDYFVIHRRVLVVDDLYRYPSRRVDRALKKHGFSRAVSDIANAPLGAEEPPGIYEYWRGFNWLAVIALALGAGTALVGLVVPPLRALYAYSWFVGFAVSFVAYYALMKLQGRKPRGPTLEQES
jgi:cytosine/uracil/thiamine/allantoin permease